tara:strand:+ start:362 stop:580 length:219 start_codon:yes stop_codon:yes gene_type:complete
VARLFSNRVRIQTSGVARFYSIVRGAQRREKNWGYSNVWRHPALFKTGNIWHSIQSFAARSAAKKIGGIQSI